MIPTGTDAQQVQPKHKRALDGPLDDVRDYPAHVCPGQHCIGRVGIIRHDHPNVQHGHRYTVAPVHPLTPEQAAAADRAWTR
jgi:hypothetical protein